MIAGGAAAGASVYGATKASRAANKGAKETSAAAHEALEYTKVKDAQDREDSLAAERANYEQWLARERRMAPYRSAGQGATNTIASMLGLPTAEFPEPPMPAYLRDGGAPPAPGTAVPRRVIMPARAPVDPNSNGYVGTVADLVHSPVGRRTNPNAR